VGPLPLVATQCNAWFYWILGWGLLSFPDRQLTSRLEKAVVWMLLVMPVGQVLMTTFSRPEWLGFKANLPWITVYPSKRHTTLRSHGSMF
jgi:hypothetical protein